MLPSLWITPNNIQQGHSSLLSNDSYSIFSDIKAQFIKIDKQQNILYALPYGNDYKLIISLSPDNNRDHQLIIKIHPQGLHPLYYYYQNDQFICSTNIRKLISLIPSFSKEINYNSLLQYYCFGFEPANASMLQHINKLPAGHTLTYTANKIHLQQNTIQASPPLPINYSNLEEVIGQVDETFEQSISSLQSVGVNGLSLSGGVDSGYTLTKLRKTNATINAYTMLYGKAYSETDRIQHLEKELGINVHKITLQAEEIRNNFETVNSLTSSPCGFNNATMNLLFKQAGTDGVHTMFDGDGADRLFLGMNRYLQLQKVLQLYAGLNKIGLSGLITMLTGFLKHASLLKTHTLFKNWNNGQVPYVERIYQTQVYNQAFEERIYKLAVLPYYTEFMEQNPVFDWKSDPFRFISYFAIKKCPEMFFHQPSELQLAHQMNATPAFWHPQMVELALQIPTGFKLKNNTTKYILRKAAAKNMSPDYWQLPKIGLQSSYKFAISDNMGGLWLNLHYEQIKKTDWLKQFQMLTPATIDYKRLLPFHIWFNTI